MAHYRPACYQDLLEGRPVHHKVGQEMMEADLGWGEHREGARGELYGVTWGWKGKSYGGGEGDVPVERYASTVEQKAATGSDAKLWVDVTGNWEAPELDAHELLIRLDMQVSGCSRKQAELSFRKQETYTDNDILHLMEGDGYRLSSKPACFARYTEHHVEISPSPGRELPKAALRAATVETLELIAAYEDDIAAVPAPAVAVFRP